ncbi:MAG: SDR family NAD(P)-dependent oxidoreductase [Anaerolineae bacterium]
MRFKDKIALVTGGSKGLGKVIAKDLASRGCQLILCARDEQALAKTGMGEGD